MTADKPWIENVFGVLADVPEPRETAPEAALGWIPISIREAIRTGNVEAAKEWATRGEVRNAEQAARIAELEERLAASRDHFVREERQHGETANRLDEWRGRAVAAETHRDTYAAALRDALDALSLMTGFVEAQHYVEKYGVNETLARLRALLPPEATVTP